MNIHRKERKFGSVFKFTNRIYKAFNTIRHGKNNISNLFDNESLFCQAEYEIIII